MRRAHVPPLVEGEAKAPGRYVACLALHMVCPALCVDSALCSFPYGSFSSISRSPGS